MPASCCAQSNADTGRLFSWMSGMNRLRYRLFGFEKNQRQLLDGIRAEGIAGAKLLEIGCGPGYLHQQLLEEGAASAVGVDLSPGMLEIARTGAKARGLSDRIDYRQGDLVALADALPMADITVLDKVVCCYPDWQALMDAALRHTDRVCALTYPRDRNMIRWGVRLMSTLLDTFHCCYRPYLHDPKLIRAHALAQGFELASEQQTGSWLTEVYVRPDNRPPTAEG